MNIQVTCRNPLCRKTFEAVRSSAKYCSNRCKLAVTRGERAKRAESEDQREPHWYGHRPTLQPDTLTLAEQAAAIIASYEGAVTLRQCYYRLVAANVIPNTERSYKRLGEVVRKAREAGIIPWKSIEDRGRSISTPLIAKSAAEHRAFMRRIYDEDRWNTQEIRVAVIVEKAALAGVIEPVCHRWQVPFIAARGYPSSTLVAEASVKLRGHHILHLGDHDPSGVDMSRDWQDRLSGFCAGAYVNRIALTREQIAEHDLPPQPIKGDDARAAGYKAQHGSGVWELDAMPPDTLAELVEKHIKAFVDEVEWLHRDREIEAVRATL